jgi:hypothetical protein
VRTDDGPHEGWDQGWKWRVKYKAALSVADGAGLRVSEVANVKIFDVGSKRMLIRVDQGKGKRIGM